MGYYAAPVLLAVLMTVSTAHSEPMFMGLGDLPGGEFRSQAFAVSADGSVVVGTSTSSSGKEAYVWQNGEMYGLGDLPGGAFESFALDVSADGSVVVGWADRNPSGSSKGFRWEDGTMTDIGIDIAWGVSAAGTVVAGTKGTQAVRWESGLTLNLGPREAIAISSDGNVIVGQGTSALGSEAFRWENGVGAGLGDLPGGTFHGLAWATSSDGGVIVGQSSSANGTEAFRWEDGEMTGLGDLPGGGFSSVAQGVSSDGSLVVGLGQSVLGTQASIWDETNGMRVLQDVLSDEFGLDLSGWNLTEAWAISEDGRVIVGEGTNPSGQHEAWRAVIPEPSTALLVSLGLIGLARRRD